jgi:hypothetical protein
MRAVTALNLIGWRVTCPSEGTWRIVKTFPCNSHSVKRKNVNLSMCVINHHTMTYGGVEVEFHAFLTSALGGSQWSASRPGRFTPGTRWIGGWVGPEPVWT